MPKKILLIGLVAGVIGAFAVHRMTRNWRQAEQQAQFFPLKTTAHWSYQIVRPGDATVYHVADRVIGREFIPALGVNVMVVDETDNLLSRTPQTHPILYALKHGYLSRISGLEYDNGAIEVPDWGAPAENDALPEHLTSGLAWNNGLKPFGGIAGETQIRQRHRTFHEWRTIVVPAGQFSSCIRVETHADFVEPRRMPLRHEDHGLMFIDWYAPNVGLVESVIRAGGFWGRELDRVELVSFGEGEGTLSHIAGGIHR